MILRPQLTIQDFIPYVDELKEIDSEILEQIEILIKWQRHLKVTLMGCQNRYVQFMNPKVTDHS